MFGVHSLAALSSMWQRFLPMSTGSRLARRAGRGYTDSMPCEAATYNDPL
jgi:hypothetical protein